MDGRRVSYATALERAARELMELTAELAELLAEHTPGLTSTGRRVFDDVAARMRQAQAQPADVQLL